MKKWLTYFVMMIVVGITAQNPVVDSLKRELAKAKHDTTRCVLLSEIIENEDDEKVWTGYNDTLIARCIRKIKSINELNSERKVYLRCYARALNNLSYLDSQHGNLSQSINNLNEGLKIRRLIGDKKGMCESLYNLGVVYNRQGSVAKALEYFEKSLKIQEEIKYKKGMAYSLHSLGEIYESQGDSMKGLEYFIKSLRIRESIGDSEGIANSLNDIGIFYENHSDYTSALDYLNRSMKMREKMGDSWGVSNALFNIASIYESRGDLNMAFDSYNKCLTMLENIGDKLGIANSLLKLGHLYYKQKNNKKALSYSLKSMELCKTLGYPESVKNAAQSLSMIYRSNGEYQQALKYYELFIQMRDSISNEVNKKASIKSQLKYEYEKKAAADSVKAGEEKKVVQAQLKQEKTQRYSLIVGLLLVTIFAVFMVNRFRVTNKQKKLIEEQKKVVEEQKYLVDEKQKEILDSIYYARRIQRALVTNEKYIARNLKKLNC